MVTKIINSIRYAGGVASPSSPHGYDIPFRFDEAGWIHIDVHPPLPSGTVLDHSFSEPATAWKTGHGKLMVKTNLANRFITITRRTPLEQPLDLEPNSPLPAQALETTLDQMVMAIQDRDVARGALNEEGNEMPPAALRLMMFPASEPAEFSTHLPRAEARKGKFIGFHAETGELEVKAFSDDVEAARTELRAFILKQPNGGIKVGDIGGNGGGAQSITLQASRQMAVQVASGTGAIVIGNSRASGIRTISLGTGNSSSGYEAVALGLHNTTETLRGCGVGHYNKTFPAAEDSIAVGNSNETFGQQSVAVGYRNKAWGYCASAFGAVSTASGLGATTVGYNAGSSGAEATAVGAGCYASDTCSSAVGSGNHASGGHAIAHGHANSAFQYASSLGVSNRAWGYYSSSFGHGNLSQGEGSVAFGYLNQVNGKHALCCGSTNHSTGDNSSSMGYGNTAENGGSCVGVMNFSTGMQSSAMGVQNVATGTDASAVGSANTARGAQSAALGHGMKVTADLVTEVGNRNPITSKQGRFRADSGSGMAALSFGSSVPMATSLATPPGEEAGGQLPVNMLSFRVSGSVLHIDMNVSGSLRTLSLTIP